MQQNSFQKNGFINVKNTVSGSGDFSQLGRRTIQDIKDDMWSAKARKLTSNDTPTDSQPVDYQQQKSSFSFHPDHKQNVENLKSFNRWK